MSKEEKVISILYPMKKSSIPYHTHWPYHTHQPYHSHLRYHTHQWPYPTTLRRKHYTITKEEK
jgi:hypothetical protein